MKLNVLAATDISTIVWKNGNPHIIPAGTKGEIVNTRIIGGIKYLVKFIGFQSPVPCSPEQIREA